MGSTAIEPVMSDFHEYDISSSAPPAQSTQSDSKRDASGPAFDYNPQNPPRSQRMDYQVPFGDTSVPVLCPVCQQRTMSKIKHVAGGYTYGWAAGLCAVLGLGCVPFCIKRLKNVEHRCGHCDEKLAIWHRYDGRVDARAWGLV